MVLKSMPQPAWLGPDAPDHDVVISTRVRVARNLMGYRFPHHATTQELKQVLQEVVQAGKDAGLGLEGIYRMSEAEREFLLGTHLISKEFDISSPGRGVLLDTDRMISIMVNEEDHLRIQVLTAGWSILTAKRASDFVLEKLSRHLDFATTSEHGHLTASASNSGAGLRTSALFHLIGLAHSKRLGKVLSSLAEKNVVIRGIYGEASRAVGAFFQVSSTQELNSDFVSSCEILIEEERRARRAFSIEEFEKLVVTAADFATSCQKLSLADALRVMAWLRWAGSVGLEGWPSDREVDSWIASMEVTGVREDDAIARHRASELRVLLGR